MTTTTPLNEGKIIKKISFVSIAGNAVLSVFKLIAGILGHSSAMISDAIHSFSDVFTTLIALVGVKISGRTADDSHPYGHERLECVASLILGLVLMITGLGIGKTGLESIIYGTYKDLSSPGAIALAAAAFSIACKEGMYWYTRNNAKKINSSAFMADAWHHRSDALSSIGALIGIGGTMLGFPVMDPAASVLICLFILKVSYDILKDALSKMLDTSCGEDYDKKLMEYISTREDIARIDMLRSRMFGSKVYVDLEIALDGDSSLKEAHDVAERIHRDVEKQFPDVKHIMIHMNPLVDSSVK